MGSVEFLSGLVMILVKLHVSLLCSGQWLCTGMAHENCHAHINHCIVQGMTPNNCHAHSKCYVCSTERSQRLKFGDISVLCALRDCLRAPGRRASGRGWLASGARGQVQQPTAHFWGSRIDAMRAHQVNHNRRQIVLCSFDQCCLGLSDWTNNAW